MINTHLRRATRVKDGSRGTMEVVIVPVLEDNYAYIIKDTTNNVAAVVDPVEPEKLLKVAKEHRVTITTILTTHSHWDHAGGNDKLVARLKVEGQENVPVVGGKNDNVQACTREVAAEDLVQVGSLDVHVLYAPCHTPGHVLYLCGDALFTGDTLFVAGCGNLNSGTPAQMHNALNIQIANLPKHTRLYVGHEYTVNNLKFASSVEPNNPAIAEKLEWALGQRKANMPTVPSTVREELETNPFMRVQHHEVQQYANQVDPVEVLRVVRERKNVFRVH